MKKLQIAVVGAGAMGRRHVELIQSSALCELSAVVDPAPGAVETARRSGVPHYRSIEELFASAHPDGVILATPNSIHEEGALACVRNGIAVLVEKPLAHSVEAGLRLCEEVESTGARVLVGHHRRHSPIIARAGEVVRQGTLGRTVAVMGSAMFCKPDHYFDEAPWRRLPGGGPILINLVHEIDNLRALCGEIEAVQAFSSNATRGFQVEDTVAIILRFAGGALGTFLLSDTVASAKSWEQTSGENTSYAHYPDEECYTICGTDGSLAVPTMRMKTYAKKEDRSWWKRFREGVADMKRADPLQAQLAHFCAVIRGETQPLVTARDGLRNLQVIGAIAEATRTGRTVAIR